MIYTQPYIYKIKAPMLLPVCLSLNNFSHVQKMKRNKEITQPWSDLLWLSFIECDI